MVKFSFCFSNDGVYVGVGMMTGSVAVYIGFSLQVSSRTKANDSSREILYFMTLM